MASSRIFSSAFMRRASSSSSSFLLHHPIFPSSNYSFRSFSSTIENNAKDQISWAFNKKPEIPSALSEDEIKYMYEYVKKFGSRSMLWGARKIVGNADEEEEEEEETRMVRVKIFLPGVRKNSIRITLREDERNQNRVMMLIEHKRPHLVNFHDLKWCGSCFTFPKKFYALDRIFADMDYKQVLTVYLPRLSNPDGFIRFMDVN